MVGGGKDRGCTWQLPQKHAFSQVCGRLLHLVVADWLVCAGREYSVMSLL